jgi:hypothetical protein
MLQWRRYNVNHPNVFSNTAFISDPEEEQPPFARGDAHT